MAVSINNYFLGATPEVKDLVALYISQLSPMETKAFNIAKEHLGTSFHIQKSNGYIQWLRENPQ